MDAVVEGYRRRLRRRRPARLRGVELSLRRAELRSSGPEPIRPRARDSGLEIHALVLGEHNSGGIADADLEVAEAAARGRARRDRLGGASSEPALFLVPFFLRGELGGDAGLARCAEAAFASLCPEAAARGVTLCFEGLLPASEIQARLAERVGVPGFGCYFDLANPLAARPRQPDRDPCARELVRQVHVKDGHVKPGDCRPGLGRVDFAEMRARTRRDRISTAGSRSRRRPGRRPSSHAISASRAQRSRGREAGRGRGSGRSPTTSAPVSGNDSARSSAGSGSSPSSSDDHSSASASTTLARRRPASVNAREHGFEVAALAGYRNLIAPDPAGGARTSTRSPAASSSRARSAPASSQPRPARDTRSATGRIRPENWGETAWRLLDDALESLVPIAERTGVVLALEATVKNVLGRRAS